MRSILLLVILTVSYLSVSAQQDEKAKGVLDKLSAKTKAFSTIKADFQFTMVNKADGLNETQSGSILIKGQSYNLSISGQTVISDGKSMWTVLKDSEEIQIAEIDEDEEDAITPNKIFTLYEKGFKYKYVKEDAGMHIINLYPKDAADKAYHRITLYVNKAKNEITKVKVHGKDGTTTTYKIKSFVGNSSIPASKFTFNKASYPNYEIIDLR